MAISFLISPALPEDACKAPAKNATASSAKEPPFACDRLALTSAERRRHFGELGPALVAARSGVRELPNGYEFQFPSDQKTFAMVAEWMEQERRCCPFFDFDLRVEHGGGAVSLRVTGRPGTKEFMQAEGGAWISPPASR
jgi:hypothetical protein